MVIPEFAVQRAQEIAHEMLAREMKFPTKANERFDLANEDKTDGELLFVTAEMACLLLYKFFENRTPPYTNNGAVYLLQCQCDTNVL